MEKLPTANDAERVYLGAILVTPALMPESIDQVAISDFYTPLHRQVFRSMTALFNDGRSIDPVLVAQHIKKTGGNIKSIGGQAAINSLMTGAPHATDLKDLAKEIRDASVARKALRAAVDLQLSLADGKDPVSAIVDHIARLSELPTNGSSGSVKPLRTTCLLEVSSQDVDWLWEPYFARGAFTLIDGEEGIGKTFLMMRIASDISTGRPLPGQLGSREPTKVLLASAEDSLPCVIKPRLESMGADCSNVFAIEDRFVLDNDGLAKLSLALGLRKPSTVIIDPLFSHTGTINLNNDSEVRSVTDALNRLAEKHKCAIIGLRHIGKSKGYGNARNAGLNGVGWRAGARSSILIGKNPQNDNQKAFVQTKNNLAPVAMDALGFEIDKGICRWTGKSDLTAAAILAFHQSESIEERGERAAAKEFLLDFLGDGPKGSKEVIDAANQVGISKRTLDRAKHDLHVTSKKEPLLNGGWRWKLPENEVVEPKVVKEGRQVNNDGNLPPDPVFRDFERTILHPPDKLCHEIQLKQTDTVDGKRPDPIGTAVGRPYTKCPRCSKEKYLDADCAFCALKKKFESLRMNGKNGQKEQP